MKVSVTFDFSETERRAINVDTGLPYPAERGEIKEWLKVVVATALNKLVDEYINDDPNSETVQQRAQ